MKQLPFTYELNKDQLRACLEKAAGRELSLVITDNATSMLSLRNRGQTVLLRLNGIFLSADEPVLMEIADFIKDRKIKTPLIMAYIRRNADRLKKVPPRKIRIRTEGKTHDLLKMYRTINDEYFNGKVSAPITWGVRRPARAAARRTLGSYCGQNNLIRINPLLDSKRVPRYYVEFIVYHEMLHADIGLKKHAGRRLHHDRTFKQREKLFKHYDRAIAWERKRW